MTEYLSNENFKAIKSYNLHKNIGSNFKFQTKHVKLLSKLLSIIKKYVTTVELNPS